MVGRITWESGIYAKARFFSVLNHLNVMLFAQFSHAIGLTQRGGVNIG